MYEIFILFCCSLMTLVLIFLLRQDSIRLFKKNITVFTIYSVISYYQLFFDKSFWEGALWWFYGLISTIFHSLGIILYLVYHHRKR